MQVLFKEGFIQLWTAKFFLDFIYYMSHTYGKRHLEIGGTAYDITKLLWRDRITLSTLGLVQNVLN